MTVMRVLSCFLAVAGLAAAAPGPSPPPTMPGFLTPQAKLRDHAGPGATATASISGRVLVRGLRTPSPVRRARITLRSEALDGTRTTDTDTDGRYSFERLPAGPYRIKAEKPGFVGLEYGAARPFVQPRPIELADGEVRTADIALPRGAALEGRVLSEDGEPVQDATVSAMRLAYGARGRRPVAVAQARTDDLGRFRVHSLPAGSYYVQTASGSLAALDGPVAPGERPTGYATTYYPGTARVDEAATVTLATGQETGQLDFTPLTVAMTRLAIRVVDAAGQRPASASCRVRPVAPIDSAIVGFGDPRTPGTFEFPAVPPGEYWVTAAAVPAAGGVREFAATRLTASGDALPALTIRTEPGARLDGLVEVDAVAGVVAPGGLQIIAHEAGFELPSPTGPSAGDANTPAATANGRFTIPSLFGPRIVRAAGLPPNWALKAVWLDEQEITDLPFDFRASQNPRTLRMVVTNRTGSVSGAMFDDQRRPAAQARVVVFPADQHRWGPWSRFVQTMAAAAGGRFAVDGLLPGDYFICAVEDLEDDAWTDASVLQRLRAIAVPISITAGGHQTVTLTTKPLQ